MRLFHGLLTAVLFLGCKAIVIPTPVGCFHESPNHEGVKYSVSFQDITGPTCSYLCFNRGFIFAAVKRMDCTCSDEPLGNIRKTEECNIRCLGNRSEMCGGRPDLSSGYYTGASDMNPVGKEVGCLDDAGELRIIPEHRLELKLTNSPDRCLGICYALGYIYGGVRNSIECYCGNIKKETPLVKGCDLPCPHYQNGTCGGLGRTMVYKANSEGSSIPSPSADYIGCFKIQHGIALDGYRVELTMMTPYTCVAECYFKGFVLAGLLEGSKCHCGAISMTVAPRSAAESRCTIDCPGFPSAKCGGPGHYSVYTTSIVGDETVGKSVGCVKNDPDSFKIMDTVHLWSDNSPKDCVYECMQLGTAFAGLTKRSECRCGNSWPKASKIDFDDECNLRCPSIWMQNCGGEKFTSVYRTGLDWLIGSDSINTDFDYQKGKKNVLGSFEDNFDTLSLEKWRKTVRISGEDEEFIVYTADEENSCVRNGKLIIIPTIQDDEFIRRGSLDLKDCTGKRGTKECKFEAKFYDVVPPIKSAQLCTTKSFKFKYGRVTIRAKLPVGDWILPQLWLKSEENEFGENYMSGKVLIASVPGNKNLKTSSGEDIGWNVLETGILASSAPDQPARSNIFKVRSSEPWSNDFHNYTIEWSQDKILFYADGDVQNSKIIYDSNGQTIAELLGFNQTDNIWSMSSNIAPFDKEFHICLGVGVGGFQGFPNEVTSNGKSKHWSNYEVKSKLRFWQALNVWRPTWTDRSRLEVDSVEVIPI